MQDVDSAAKFIGAGAATVGVAGQLIFFYGSKFSIDTGHHLLVFGLAD